LDDGRNGVMASASSVGGTKMSDHETRSKSPITTMVPQLGSSPRMMAKGEWDMRLLSNIMSPEKMPSSFKSVLYFLVVRDIVENDKSYLDALVDNYLILVNSIDGRGRNDQLKAENALKGLSVPTEQAPPAPSLLQRLTGADEVREYENYKARQEAGLE